MWPLKRWPRKTGKCHLLSRSFHFISSVTTRDRLLGLRDGTKLGFWRNLVGQGEKWVILKAQAATSGSGFYQQSSGGKGPLGRVSCEESGSRGCIVRLGDSVLLQTNKSDHLLTLQWNHPFHQTAHGLTSSAASPAASSSSVELVYRDRLGSGSGINELEFWQIEQFGSIPTPLWFRNRPYLR